MVFQEGRQLNKPHPFADIFRSWTETACETITWTSHIPSSSHLGTRLNRKNLNIGILCLGFFSIVMSKSDPNLGAILGMLKKAASGVLAILPCSRTPCTLRASKWLRPCWIDPSARLRACFFEHSLQLMMAVSSCACICHGSEIFNNPILSKLLFHRPYRIDLFLPFDFALLGQQTIEGETTLTGGSLLILRKKSALIFLNAPPIMAKINNVYVSVASP